jgi:hypothetical protein
MKFELFTKDVWESFALIGVITAALVWYGWFLARREAREREDRSKAA